MKDTKFMFDIRLESGENMIDFIWYENAQEVADYIRRVYGCNTEIFCIAKAVKNWK